MALALIGVGGAAALVAAYYCASGKSAEDDAALTKMATVDSGDALMELFDGGGKCVVYLSADW